MGFVLFAGLGCTRAEPIDPPRRTSFAVALPTVTQGEAIPPGAIEILVGRGSISHDDRRVTTIDEREGGAFGAEHHRIRGLDPVLAADDRAARVVVHADESAPFGAVIDTLYTASRTGHEHLAFAVVVDGVDAPRTRRVFPARTWDPDREVRMEDANCPTWVVFGDDEVRLAGCGEPQIVVQGSVLPALHALATRMHIWGRHDALHVSATARTPWWRVVEAIDAITAPVHAACMPTQEAGTCREWNGVVLDLEPGLPWTPGDWDRLRLSVHDVDARPSSVRPRRYDEAKLRTRLLGLLPALETCLREDAAMRVRVPRCLSFLLAFEEGREVVLPVEPAARRCLESVVAPMAEHWGRLVPGDAQVSFAIDVPGATGGSTCPRD